MFSTKRSSLRATAVVAVLATSVVSSVVSAAPVPTTPDRQIDTSNTPTPTVFPAVAAAGTVAVAIGGAVAWAADKLYELGKVHGKLSVAGQVEKQPTDPVESTSLQGLDLVLD